MKRVNKLIIGFLAGLFLMASCNQNMNDSGRISVDLNSDWTFNYLPELRVNPDLCSEEYDDSEWPAVALPHTWQTYETTGDIHPFIKYPSERDDPYWWKGWGYYRKHFQVATHLDGKKIEVEFDGVQKYSIIYLNGEYVGDHKGGFTSFYFDLTPFIRFGEENVLAVAVSNRRDDVNRIPPMTAGNWDLYGGIYRDARLVIKDRLHIPYQGSYKHEGGTFITTPKATAEKALVSVKTYIKNDYQDERHCRLLTRIIDPSGKIHQELEREIRIAAGEMTSITQLSDTIFNPELWHPDSPQLYKVLSFVFDGEKLSDQYESPLGIRWFRWDYEHNDLWINGEKMIIRGINRHQEYPWLGDAIPKWITEMDYLDMRENLGFNFTRATHYPNDPYVYELTDKLGFACAEEVPNIKSIDFSEEVQEQNVREMIRRDRNHPSILFWSMGNETNDAADSKWAIQEDTTRIIHVRKGEDAGDFVDHNSDNLDMENLLRVTQRGWFDEESAPQERETEPENGQHAGTNEWQHLCATIPGSSVRGALDLNTVIWLYEDHGADREYKNNTLKHINPKGWVDLYRVPKYVYHLTRAQYLEEPVLVIHGHHWSKKNIDRSLDLIIDSNCDDVELFVNGKSKGIKHPMKNRYRTITFEGIEIEDGLLEAVGTKDGKEIRQSIIMPGEPARIRLESSHTKIPAGRNGNAIIMAQITDKDGNPIMDAMNSLTWEVSGPATLVGHSVYETDYYKKEEFEGTGYTVAPVANVIRSTTETGKIRVSVSSPGLDPGEVVIQSFENSTSEGAISQPILMSEGRKKITRNEGPLARTGYIEEIAPIKGNLNVEGSGPEQYKTGVRELIMGNNPAVEKQGREFIALVDWFGDYLSRMNGELIADDFNFQVQQYNLCRSLNLAIDQSNLPYVIANEMYRDNTEKIITMGQSTDLDSYLDFLSKIPEKYIIINIEGINKKSGKPIISDLEVHGSHESWAANFDELLQLVWPELSSMSTEDQERYMKNIERLNPMLSSSSGYRIKEDAIYILPDPEQFSF